MTFGVCFSAGWSWALFQPLASSSPSSPVPSAFPCRPVWRGTQGPIWACPPTDDLPPECVKQTPGPPRAPIQRAGRGPVDLRSQEAPKCAPSSRPHRHCPHSRRAPTHRLALHLCLNAIAYRRQDGLWLSQHRSHSSQAEDRCYLLFSGKLASPRPQQSHRTSSVPGAVLCPCGS